MKKDPINWEEYNEPPFLPQWMCEDETLLMASFDDCMNKDIEQQIRKIIDQYDLDNAKGELLDRIGKFLNEKRDSDTDDFYRIRLKVKKLLNTSNGSINDIIKISKVLYSSEDVNIVPNYPAGLRILHDGEGTPGIDFNKILRAVVAAGVAYNTTELFNFFEHILMTSKERTNVRRNSQDLFPSGLRHNGRFLCDQGKVILCNGDWVCDGSMTCSGVISVIGTIFDYFLQELFCNGKWICNGDKDCSGFERIYEDEFIQLPILPREYMRDELFILIGTEQETDSAEVFHDIPMNIKIINPLICDGSKMPACSLCDGTIVCDGSYTGYDGRYYRDEIMEEVI
jgi:hypothetical protein